MISLNPVHGAVYGLGDWHTHLPILTQALTQLRPMRILELGSGQYSTRVLNAYSAATGATVLSLENDFAAEYHAGLRHMSWGDHELRRVQDWDYRLYPGKWDLVFVDQGPEPARILALDWFSKGEDKAGACIVHDANYRDRYQALLERYQYCVVDRTHRFHTALMADVDVETPWVTCPGADRAWNWPPQSMHC